jgi:hypothetical protein
MNIARNQMKLKELGVREAVQGLHGQGRAKSKKRSRAGQTTPKRRTRSSRFNSESFPSESSGGDGASSSNNRNPAFPTTRRAAIRRKDEDSESDESPELSFQEMEDYSEVGSQSSGRSQSQSEPLESGGDSNHHFQDGPFRPRIEKVFDKVFVEIEGVEFWKVVKSQEQRQRLNMGESKLLSTRKRRKPEPLKVYIRFVYVLSTSIIWFQASSSSTNSGSRDSGEPTWTDDSSFDAYPSHSESKGRSKQTRSKVLGSFQNQPLRRSSRLTVSSNRISYASLRPLRTREHSQSSREETRKVRRTLTEPSVGTEHCLLPDREGQSEVLSFQPDERNCGERSTDLLQTSHKLTVQVVNKFARLIACFIQILKGERMS